MARTRSATHPSASSQEHFLGFLAKNKKRFDARLKSKLKAELRRFPRVGPTVKLTAGSLVELCERGGKRVRPGLLLAGCICVNDAPDLEVIADAGAALELLHGYFLVHDDWMDGDLVRRGGPSVHAALRDRLGSSSLGDAAAIMAGDWGVAVATDWMARLAIKPRILSQALQCFTAMQLAAVTGQIRDLLATDDRPEITYELKTASYTVSGPLKLGAILGRATKTQLQALDRFALPIGIAFQLRDDLIGVFSPESVTGKPFASDSQTREANRPCPGRTTARSGGHAQALEPSLRQCVRLPTRPRRGGCLPRRLWGKGRRRAAHRQAQHRVTRGPRPRPPAGSRQRALEKCGNGASRTRLMTSSATAEGKVILLGEHAVVYGHPAIVTALDQGARASATRSAKSALVLAGTRYVIGQGEVGTALGELLEVLHAQDVEIEAEISIPAGLGLGASAALGVAIARAILQLVADDGLPQDERLELVQRAAQAWETVFHGTPSGIDVAAASLGGCFSFTRKDGPVPIHVARPLTLAVGIVGPKVSTKVMVSGVAELRRKHPDLVNDSLGRIRALVENARHDVEIGDLVALGHAMDDNQVELGRLGLSTDALERACEVARGSGALGAKLTGKGGGGCVVALCSKEPQIVLEAWRNIGLEGFASSVAASATFPRMDTRRPQT
ncbi:MAG: mevalonate kinase [Polyangiaceae bacterium]